MTNPARRSATENVEALKAVLEDRLVKDLFYVYEGNLEKYLTAVHALGQLEAQSEQTPVVEVAKAGRIVSEEVFQQALTAIFNAKNSAFHSGNIPEQADLKAAYEALRAAPVYHKEES